MTEDWIWEDKPIDVELAEIERGVQGTGWKIRREVVLGLFSFQKFVMYRDLLDNEERIVEHPVVQSLAHKQLTGDLLQTAAIVPELEELDDVQSPDQDFSILDADATQRRCIEAAKRGQSFVMHGPPGTGKSQTISNIIAHSIAAGQRVLFVSEKAAALDVVHKRLAAQGLDEFCLLLHGQHAARREVVEALHRTMTTKLDPRQLMTSHDLDRLGRLRELLNSTAELLHLPMERLGDRSLREVLGELAALDEAPSLGGAPVPSEGSSEHVRNEFQQLDDLSKRLGERWSASPRDFLWRGYGGVSFTTHEHGHVLGVVDAVASTSALLEEVAQSVASLIGWPAPATARAVESLLELGEHAQVAPRLSTHWLSGGQSAELARVAAEARETLDEFGGNTAKLAAFYPGRPLSDFDSSMRAELRTSLEELEKLIGRPQSWEHS
jgi:hypothetical protein